MTQEEYLQKLCENYSAYYDITMANKKDDPLLAELELHREESKTAFFGTVPLASMTTHHYLYVFGTENLSEDALNKCCERATKQALAKIKPDSTHLESLVTALFLYRNAEDNVLKKATKKKFTKNFLFSLHGWMKFEAKTVNLNNI